jgi:hypothetical protein
MTPKPQRVAPLGGAAGARQWPLFEAARAAGALSLGTRYPTQGRCKNATK